jgi:hypothetical protein
MTMVFPRMLSEIMSSPGMEDTCINVESNCYEEEYTELAGPIPTLHMHPIACKVEQVAKDREALGAWWKRQGGFCTKKLPDPEDSEGKRH